MFVPILKMNSFDFNQLNLDELVKDPDKFNSLIFTSIDEAKNEVQKRWNDADLKTKIENCLTGSVPEPMQSKCKAVLFRQVFSPNHEFERFISLVDKLSLEPVFIEYCQDKFTSQNPLKHALGKIRFQENIEQGKNIHINSNNIIQFNGNDGKKLSEVITLWGQPLISFHHELLEMYLKSSTQYIFDASDWFHLGGKTAREYYSHYLTLFIRNGILFENFLLQGKELSFVREIFLPAFIDIWKKFGVKPIIVSLLPIDTQDDLFWLSYSKKFREIVSHENAKIDLSNG